MLSDIIVPELVNHRCDSTGIDSRQHCLDQSYFDSFPLAVSYRYNERGFRDKEWPVSLDGTVCCIGDSFTVGLGLPFDLIWPSQLRNQISVPVVNISMDGASNQWILRMAKSILAEFTPKVFVCMWSYAHRREADWPGATSMQRRTHFNVNTDMVDDYNLFQDAVRELRDHRAVHLVIPNWHPLQDAPKIWQDIRGESWPEDLPLDLSSIPASCVQEIDEVHGIGDDFFTRINLYWQFQALKHDFQFIDYDQVDWARDRHHLGADSCKLLADKIAAVIGVP